MSARAHTRVLTAIVSSVVFASAVTAHAEFRAVPGREYREVFNATNQVRGEAVVALVLAPTDESQRTDTVRVLLPTAYSGELTVEIMSADGRFRGEGSFVGSRGDAEWAVLQLKPPVKLPRPISAETLALAVRGAGGELFVARWGAGGPSSATESLRMYINSGRADVFVAPGTSKPVHCRPLAITQSLRYDRYCDVPLVDTPVDGRFRVIRRDQFEEQVQTIKVHLPR